MKKLPPVEYLKECFRYKRNTGQLFWKRRPKKHFVDVVAQRKWNTRNAGNEAFQTIVKGYRYSHIDGVRYVAHRIIWKLENGKDPSSILDHKNKRREHCYIRNLRLANHSKNAANSALKNSNRSGCAGVNLHRGRWIVRIRTARKRIYVGSSRWFPIAQQMRREAEIKYFGEFAP